MSIFKGLADVMLTIGVSIIVAAVGLTIACKSGIKAIRVEFIHGPVD